MNLCLTLRAHSLPISRAVFYSVLDSRWFHICEAEAQSKRPSGSVVSGKRRPLRALSGKRFQLRMLRTSPRDSTAASSEKEESDATSTSADAMCSMLASASTRECTPQRCHRPLGCVVGGAPRSTQKR